MTTHIVELTDESDDLIGYGICVETQDSDVYRMLPAVYGTRSEAHAANWERE